jgi:hypothetical protein
VTNWEVWAKWAYIGAFRALSIDPGGRIAVELAALTPDTDALAGAIEAMRDAPENGRVFAALDYLRAHHRPAIGG